MWRYVCVCVCWYEGLKDTWPGTWFSRLQAVTGSKARSHQTAPPSFPIKRNGSSAALCFTFLQHASSFFLTLARTHAGVHTRIFLPLFFCEMSWGSQRVAFPITVSLFKLQFPPPDWGQHEAIGMESLVQSGPKLLHLGVFVKLRSQESVTGLLGFVKHLWVWSKTLKWSVSMYLIVGIERILLLTLVKMQLVNFFPRLTWPGVLNMLTYGARG